MSNRRTPSRLYGDYPGQLAYFTRKCADGCWEFTGYITSSGYGQLGRNVGAHRVAWEVAHGRPLPDGLVVDHLCHNADLDCPGNACRHRRCVNPDHLEAVASAVNITRGRGFAAMNAAVEECPEGHPYTPENTYSRPDRPGRLCRACRYEAGKRFAASHRARLAQIQRDLRRAQNPVDFAIREWAAVAGLPISMHGPISMRVRNAYAEAHRPALADTG